MPTDTAEHWATIATRLAQGADGAASSTSSRSPPPPTRGNVTPAPPGRGVHRPVRGAHRRRRLLRHARRRAPRAGGAAAGRADVADDLAEAASAAARRLRRARADPAHARSSPQAPEADACGRERYQLVSRYFLGAAVDLEETYAWGQEELARITAEMERRGRADQARRHGQGGDRRCSTPTRPTSCTAPTSCGPGCRSGPTRPSPSLAGTPLRHPRAGAHDRVPDRPDPDRAASTTPARATTSPARAGCGGRCPRASPSSAPGAS